MAGYQRDYTPILENRVTAGTRRRFRNPSMELGGLASTFEDEELGLANRVPIEEFDYTPEPSDKGPVYQGPEGPDDLRVDPRNFIYTAQAQSDPVEEMLKRAERGERVRTPQGPHIPVPGQAPQPATPANLPQVDPWARRPGESLDDWFKRLQVK